MHIGRSVVNIIITLASTGALLSLGALFSGYHLLLDVISHFRVQYIVLLLPVFFIAILAKKIIPTIIITLALAAHGYIVASSLLPTPTRSDPDYLELTVLNSNLLMSNANYQAQLDIIEEKKPDIIAFEEYTHLWHEVLVSSLQDYPYQITHPSYGAFGIALYSKHPITNGGVDYFTISAYPVINVDVQLADNNVRIIAVHPPPPSTALMHEIRNKTMHRIASESSTQDNAVIVMGDFNSTPWTSHFSDMTSDGGLSNTRAGHGFHPTWPSGFFPLLIPIDHILVNSYVGIQHFESIFLEGSDHRNILSRLRIY
ncbi:MAG: endonuclease/exonuclease/phosphatase family protein [Granulosicoccus sp.]